MIHRAQTKSPFSLCPEAILQEFYLVHSKATYSSLQLMNLAVQKVEAITKKRRGGSRRMYWERTSVPVSVGRGGRGGGGVCGVCYRCRVSRCIQWSCYSSLTTEEDGGSSKGSNGRFHQFPDSEVGQRNHKQTQQCTCLQHIRPQ